MACWKVLDLRFRFCLPWTLFFAALMVYSYHQFLAPAGNYYSTCTYADKLGCGALEAIFRTTSSAGIMQRPGKPIYKDRRRIAVCLVGGAGMFEITARSLRKHLLEAYHNTDVFLHSPLDGESHKFTLLAAARNLRAAKVFVPPRIPVTPLIEEVIITSAGSSNAGMQAMLQEFNLVEGCYDMVREYERKQGWKYDWIMRARVDSYWTAPVPDIARLDARFYYVAAGSNFRGLNDRFGMGNGRTSKAANARLRLLPLMQKRGLRELNSELAYKAQLDLSGVQYKRVRLPFCVMTVRTQKYPPPPYGQLVLSMGSQGPLSGGYCRPCDREVNATASELLVDSRMVAWDWPGVEGRNVTVCDARESWAPNWREIASAAYRRHFPGENIPDFRRRSLRQCVREVRAFQNKWETWNSPPAETICKQAYV